MAFPKIVYPSGGAITLLFHWQPLRFTPFHKVAVRHDTVATGGLQQTVVERVDDLLMLQMENVPRTATDGTADLGDWNDFMQEALKGVPFDYYSDQGNAEPDGKYILTDSEFLPSWTHTVGAIARYRFTLTARKATL